MKPNSSVPVLAVVVAGLFSGCAPSEPAPPKPASTTFADTDPHATGAKPMTAEERAKFEKIAPRVTTIEPNELARERLNAERKARGLPPLPAEPASPPPLPEKK